MVGVSGFEPEASCSRSKRNTKLCHTPICVLSHYSIKYFHFQEKTHCFFAKAMGFSLWGLAVTEAGQKVLRFPVLRVLEEVLGSAFF